MTIDRSPPESAVERVTAAPVDERAAQIAYRIFNAPRAEWPFPHAVFGDIFPPDLFEALRALNIDELGLSSRAPIEGVAASEVHRHSLSIQPDTPVGDHHPLVQYVYKTLSHPICVRALSRYFARDLLAAFGRTDLPLSTSLLLVEDRTGYALLPHTDVPHEAVTLLVYLADEGADPSLGTELYMPAPGMTLSGGYPMRGRFQRGPFVRTTTAPYNPNCGVMFPPSPKSLHGVEEVIGEYRTRRLLQFQIMVDDPSIRRIDDTKATA